MDKARVMIISSVPIVMTINLLLLNYYCGNKIVVNNKEVSGVKQLKNRTYADQPKKKIIPVENNDELKIINFAPPPSHTIVNSDNSDMVTSNEEIRRLGKILK